jgi:hypothetical protein
MERNFTLGSKVIFENRRTAVNGFHGILVKLFPLALKTKK